MNRKLDEQWRQARQRICYELKIARLENDIDSIRKSAEPYDAGGDAVCGNCDLTLGSYEDFVSSYRFCPYCGCKLTWGAYWTGEYLC